MNAERNWEQTLQAEQFDLPQEQWLRMENDMRAWLAGQARQARVVSPPPARSWREWFKPARWGMVLGGLAVAGMVWVGLPRAVPVEWKAGESKRLDGKYSWKYARVELQGQALLTLESVGSTMARLRLDSGEARFVVHPRRAGETFQVDLEPDCEAKVVGTSFRVRKAPLGSWIEVEEGTVAFLRSGTSRLVSGSKAFCREEPVVVVPAASAKVVALEPLESPRAQAVPAAAEPQVEVPSCQDTGPCLAILAKFVQDHPSHQAKSEIALRWARLARKAGDPRDALVAYSLVQSPTLADQARLESLEVRAAEFGQAKQVSDTLDRWLAATPESSGRWKQLATLKLDLLRQLGQADQAKSFEERLNRQASGTKGP